MEALRTRNDSLQWEVQRLDAENRRLRERNPEEAESVDREAELEKARSDVAEMTNRVQACEQQREESARALEGAERRAVQAEKLAEELGEKMKVLSAAHPEGVSDRTPDATEFRELEGALRECEESLATARTELSRAEAELREQHDLWATEREAIFQRTELDRYRALDEERRKWEEREKRLYGDLKGAEEELRAIKSSRRTSVTAVELAALEEQLRTLASQLESAEGRVSELTSERDERRISN